MTKPTKQDEKLVYGSMKKKIMAMVAKKQNYEKKSGQWWPRNKIMKKKIRAMVAKKTKL